MRWIDVNSVNELKALGKFRDVTKEIKNDVGENIKIGGRSWKEVFTSIVKFRATVENLGYTHQTNVNNNMYFKSKSNEYIFYLTELNDDTRLKKLGVIKTHYTNEKRAKSWRDKILKEIQSQDNPHPKSSDAIEKLNKIYNTMIAK